MSSDDPFSDDDDRTVLRPSPGGRKMVDDASPQPSSDPAPKPSSLQSSSPRAQTSRNISSTRADPTDLLGGSINLLVDSASSILVLAPRLRQTVSQQDVDFLRRELVDQIKSFESAAHKGNYPSEVVLTGRYLLCCYLDEAILMTPWGGESGWSSNSLLSIFHNETWGGEKFFQVTEGLLRSPSQNIDTLELVMVCLSLGFEGKYSVMDRGLSQLSQLQDDIYRAIADNRGDFERELSPSWRGVTDQRNILIKHVPLWVVAAIAGLLLLVLYAVFSLILDKTVSPMEERIDDLKTRSQFEQL